MQKFMYNMGAFYMSIFTGLYLNLHPFLHKSKNSYFTSGVQIFTPVQTSLLTQSYLSTNDLGERDDPVVIPYKFGIWFQN